MWDPIIFLLFVRNGHGSSYAKTDPMSGCSRPHTLYKYNLQLPKTIKELYISDMRNPKPHHTRQLSETNIEFHPDVVPRMRLCRAPLGFHVYVGEFTGERLHNRLYTPIWSLHPSPLPLQHHFWICLAFRVQGSGEGFGTCT